MAVFAEAAFGAPEIGPRAAAEVERIEEMQARDPPTMRGSS
jgi:hypothetical protein